jgi:hypothetical protein
VVTALVGAIEGWDVDRLVEAWGLSVEERPTWKERADAWSERVTGSRIDSDPQVIEAAQDYQEACAALLNSPEPAHAARLAA